MGSSSTYVQQSTDVKMLLLVIPAVLFQVANIQVAGVQQESRPLSYAYRPRDDCVCLGCGPGEFVSRHCVQCGKKSSCRPCPQGTFSSTAGGATKCQHCHICNAGVNKVKDCNPVSDTVCGCPKDTIPLIPDGKILLCSPIDRSPTDNLLNTTDKPSGDEKHNLTFLSYMLVPFIAILFGVAVVIIKEKIYYILSFLKAKPDRYKMMYV